MVWGNYVSSWMSCVPKGHLFIRSIAVVMLTSAILVPFPHRLDCFFFFRSTLAVVLSLLDILLAHPDVEFSSLYYMA